MADNFIEKRMEEINSGGAASGRPLGIDALLAANRSTRGFDASYIVHEFQLRAIISVNCRVGSAMNRQILRFLPVTSEKAAALLPLLGIGGALKELHLPLAGTEPNAFIVICSRQPDAAHYEFDEGIAAQSMLLKAVQMGLSGLIVKNFDREKVKQALNLELTPTTVVAIGRGIEKFSLRTVSEGDSLKYYRENGIHIVPKLKLEDIIL